MWGDDYPQAKNRASTSANDDRKGDTWTTKQKSG